MVSDHNSRPDYLAGLMYVQKCWNPCFLDSLILGNGYLSMEYYGNANAHDPGVSVSVTREVIGFFKANPFLLVSEARLATLLCRPPELVYDAVRSLEESGLLARKFGKTLLGAGDNLAKAEL